MRKHIYIMVVLLAISACSNAGEVAGETTTTTTTHPVVATTELLAVAALTSPTTTTMVPPEATTTTMVPLETASTTTTTTQAAPTTTSTTLPPATTTTTTTTPVTTTPAPGFETFSALAGNWSGSCGGWELGEFPFGIGLDVKDDATATVVISAYESEAGPFEGSYDSETLVAGPAAVTADGTFSAWIELSDVPGEPDLTGVELWGTFSGDSFAGGAKAHYGEFWQQYNCPAAR